MAEKSIMELMNLKGRTAAITGASGALGKIFAKSLAEIGANLILIDIDDSSLAVQGNTLKQKWGVDVATYNCDLEDSDDRTALISAIMSNHSSLNILVNNAALVGSSNLVGWSVPFEEQSLDAWNRALEVNLTSVFHLSQGLTPLLRNSEGANIINIASIYGFLGPDWGLYDQTDLSNPAGYSASKGGLIQLSRWMATTISPQVRVNTISPGGILRNQPKIFIEKYQQRTPLNRMAQEEDIVGALVFLATDLSQYVTGEMITVDGGWSAW